jgi:hypothetical protein
MMHHGMPFQHLSSNHMQRTSMGGSQGLVLQEYHGGMWGKGAWKWLKGKSSSGRSNNASKGVTRAFWWCNPGSVFLQRTHDHGAYAWWRSAESHSIWRELNKWFPTSMLGNYSVFKGEPRSKWMCMEAHWKVFGVWSREELTNKEIVSGTPSSMFFTHGCERGFWGAWERPR